MKIRCKRSILNLSLFRNQFRNLRAIMLTVAENFREGHFVFERLGMISTGNVGEGYEIGVGAGETAVDGVGSNVPGNSTT